jgi:hypothetical protein
MTGRRATATDRAGEVVAAAAAAGDSEVAGGMGVGEDLEVVVVVGLEEGSAEEVVVEEAEEGSVEEDGEAGVEEGAEGEEETRDYGLMASTSQVSNKCWTDRIDARGMLLCSSKEVQKRIKSGF